MGDVGEIDLDPDVGVLGQLAPEPLDELLRPLLREHTDRDVAPAAMRCEPLCSELVGERSRSAPPGEVDDDVPVELALALRLLGLGRLARRVLRFLLRRRRRQLGSKRPSTPPRRDASASARCLR